MSPCVNVCAVGVLNKCVDAGTLRTVIQKVVCGHAILHSHVGIDVDGSAFLCEGQKECEVCIQEFSSDVQQLVTEQECIPFQIDHGEYMRVFYKNTENGTQLVVIAHHIVCDGGSIMIFMKDVLLALNGQRMEQRPVQLLSGRDLPRHPKLNVPMRLMMKRTNERWKKSGKVFGFREYYQMVENYHAEHKTEVSVYEIQREELRQLKALCRENKITLNSLLVAAFAAVLQQGEGIGIAVNVRPENKVSMGNYATGISVKAEYDDTKTLVENAVVFHDRIYRKLNHPREKYFLHEFMGALEPTLIDSIYFMRYAAYQNPVSEAVCSMCGYTGSPSGISTSNLGILQMPRESAWKYCYDGLYFIPPYIPNVQSVIGISTYEDKLTLVLRMEAGVYTEKNICRKMLELIMS